MQETRFSAFVARLQQIKDEVANLTPDEFRRYGVMIFQTVEEMRIADDRKDTWRNSYVRETVDRLVAAEHGSTEERREVISELVLLVLSFEARDALKQVRSEARANRRRSQLENKRKKTLPEADKTYRTWGRDPQQWIKMQQM